MGVLVLLSLALITISFREPSTGALRHVEGAGATVLRPFEVGAERVARPFRDVYGYFRGLVHAKSENKRLRGEVDRYKQEAIQGRTAIQANKQFRAQLHYVDSPQFPGDYSGVNTRVLGRAPSEFDQQVMISAGSDRGIHVDTPIVTQDGLVGRATQVTGSAAQVTLITDEQSAVEALDVKTRAFGLIQHGQGRGSLLLNRVTKDQNVQVGDVIITAGTRSRQYPSLYPYGIPVGTVTFVGQSDIGDYKQIQIDPFVDFSSLDSVTALITHKRIPVAP